MMIMTSKYLATGHKSIKVFIKKGRDKRTVEKRTTHGERLYIDLKGKLSAFGVCSADGIK